MTRFAGFPAGSLRAVLLPELLFAELLPRVDSLAELKVTLHVLWRTGAGARAPAWLPLEQLRHDPVLVAGLGDQPGGAAAAIVAGVDAAAARGSLGRATVGYRDGEREVVAANTARGRRALAALKARAGDLGAPPLPRPTPGPRPDGRPAIFALYESNVGLVQPLIAEELRQAADLYPADWVEDAFAEAVAYNRRSWRYVKRILERWATEGRGSHAAPRERTVGGPRPEAKRRWYQTYQRGEGLPDV
jgi:DNA replication protein